MAKSDKPVNEIDTSRARQQLGSPSLAGDKSINGLDSETADGDVFAMGAYYGDGGRYVSEVSESGKPLDGLAILEFLTQAPMRGSLNVWYNLNFDANVILKALDRENLRDIQMHNQTAFEAGGKTWEITYIPRKILKITDGDGKHNYEHFDASQFTYSGGLESAAEDWLGIENGKLNDDLEAGEFGLNADGELNDYITGRIADIRKYLKQDCKLTADIMSEIVDTAEGAVDPKIPMGKPYSTGYMAADYIRNRLEYKPGYSSEAVQSAAWQAYRGGRFEIVKRGDVGRVYGPDINSAYPAVMSELPDPATLDWRLFGEGNRREPIGDADLETADYGFVKVTVYTDPERPVQPFAVKNKYEGGRIEYPALQGVTLWVLKDTFQYALEADLILDYELEGAALGYETEETVYPFGFFKQLYDKRKSLKAAGEDKPAKLLKIVMNSIYGKTCQTNIKRQPVERAFEIIEGVEEGDSLHIDDIPDKYDLVTDHRGAMYLEYSQAGRLFNPFIASYITGRTRLNLLRGVVDNGLEDSVVMLATDSLMIEADAFESSELYAEAEREPDTYAEALGGWDYDYVGDGFVVGSGLYQVDRTDKDKVKLGLRGFKDFRSSDNDFDTLREAADMYPEGVPITTTRPVTMGDILQKNMSMAEIGVFTETERTLSAAMDSKRSWETDSPTFPGLLSGTEESKPKIFTWDGQFKTQDL